MKKAFVVIAWFVLGIAMPSVSNAGSIFLCRVYSGGSIWSSTRCDPSKAAVEREIMVPDGLAWDQQVIYGEQRQAASRALQATPAQNSNSVSTTSYYSNILTQCKALAVEIENYYSMSRQPQSRQMQDWIADSMQKARAKQFGLHCQ